MELMYALMVMMKYDDMVQMNIVELNALYFWVRITKVPSLFEELDTIKDIASSNGNFIQLDEKVFENIGRVRVRISYELAKHVFQKKKTYYLLRVWRLSPTSFQIWWEMQLLPLW